MILDTTFGERGGHMPIKIQKDLPAKVILESENIFVMDEERAMSRIYVLLKF